MNLDRISSWAAAIVLAFATVGRLSAFQNWIWKAQARVIHESRTSTWGSPRFWPAEKMDHQSRDINLRSNYRGPLVINHSVR
jgi:hypothetical protein